MEGMADFDSLAYTGRSIVRLLNYWFAEQNPHPMGTATNAVLIRTEDFKTDQNNDALLVPPTVSSTGSTSTGPCGRPGRRSATKKVGPTSRSTCTFC